MTLSPFLINDDALCKNYIFFITTYWYILSTSHKNTKAFAIDRSIYIDRSICGLILYAHVYISTVARLVLAVRSRGPLPPPASTVKVVSSTLENPSSRRLIRPLSFPRLVLLLLLQKKKK